MTKKINIALGDHLKGSLDQHVESGGDGSASEVARHEDHDQEVAALHQALSDGENSGEADELDMTRIKARARQLSSH